MIQARLGIAEIDRAKVGQGRNLMARPEIRLTAAEFAALLSQAHSQRELRLGLRRAFARESS
ncbi:MAG TPA: hypothetical protein VMA37_15530 [Acetobacteraceae bacterium]|nr:hypothetical protein [Acetobacteraceae bacterium]